MHHVALDRAWTDDGDLDHEVVKYPRLQARQHVHLRAALDLKHTERFPEAQHAVDLGIVLRDTRQSPALTLVLIDQIKAEAKTKRGIDLETEVQIVGETDTGVV